MTLSSPLDPRVSARSDTIYFPHHNTNNHKPITRRMALYSGQHVFHNNKSCSQHRSYPLYKFVHQSPNAPAYTHQAPVSQGGYGPPPTQSAVPQSYNNQSPAMQQQQQHQYTTTTIQQQPQQSYTPVAAHQQSYMGQQSYGSPVVFSMVSSEQGLGGNQSPPCMYQSKLNLFCSFLLMS